jgi:hypothetical protein
MMHVGMNSLLARQPLKQQAGASAESDLQNVEAVLGPFVVGAQNYTILLHDKRIRNAKDSSFAQTLASLEIMDATSHSTYQINFPYSIDNDRFQKTLSVSADLASGKTGTGLLIHYREKMAQPPAGLPQGGEYWQIFSMVNGKLALLGKPTPIGQPAAGGPYMGVIMRAAKNGAVSVISEPDVIDVHAWTGNFYVLVPLRVDWNHGGLSEGQRCMGMVAGGMKEEGCDMQVEAHRKTSAAEYGFARLYSEADEGMGIAEHIVIQQESKVEVLGSKAITRWNQQGEFVQPVFSDVWLHVRIDGRDGWIHGEEDFAAVGLPAGSPTP